MKTSSRTMILLALFAATLGSLGCAADPPPDDDGDDVAGCRLDNECSGERICESGVCVTPGGEGEGEGEGEGPVCGNGVCESGETEACSDCDSDDPYAQLRVTNTTSLTIWYLYVARCSDASWGPDQLGGNIISAGSTFTITSISPNCYDLRATTQSGETFWETRNNYFAAGETYTWTLTP